MSRHQERQRELRYRIAREAARLLADSGGRDYLGAKRKAAARLGVGDTLSLPDNREIEQALMDYQQLFQADVQPTALYQRRVVALQAMRFLAPFRPRLVGPVLEGSADVHSEVNLHLFADTVEDVGFYLESKAVPAQLTQRNLRTADGNPLQQPEYHFFADDVPVALTVFTGSQGRTPPLSPVDGRPMRRAGSREVESLLEPVPKPESPSRT